MKEARLQQESIVYTGFLAQEVEKAANECKFNFSGVYKPKEEKSIYSLRYSEFVIPLVKAVREQQKLIEDMKKENADLKTRLENLKQLKKK